MLDTKPQSLHDWVRQWEAAGEQLAEVSSDSPSLCQATSASRSQSVSNAKDLISRMGDMLEDLPVLMESQIVQSRCTLARTRNRLVASFSSIPQEILAEIFTLVVNDRSVHRVRNISMIAGVQVYYRRLYSLISVCSIWRNAALSHGGLWSLIPMAGQGSGWPGQQATEISLDRARGHHLHLAAHFQTKITLPHIPILRNRFHRCRTINVVADSHQLLREILPTLFNQPISSLTEFSLHCTPTRTNRLPEPNDFLAHTNQTNPDHIGILRHTFGSLVILRLQNVHVDWELFTFPKLVELRVETIKFQSVPKFEGFIATLSAAPMLQKLEVIDVSIESYDEEDFPDTIGPVATSFPALQQLYIGDLCISEIRLLLESISPGSYTLSLNLSPNSTVFYSGCFEDEPVFDELLESLQGVKVDVLLIDGYNCCDEWVSPKDLHRLLRHLPSVTTLKINSWSMMEEYWEALTVPPQASLAEGAGFPNLRSVEITACFLEPLKSEATIHKFLSGHSLQQFTLGGRSHIEQTSLYQPISNCKQSTIVPHLESKIPDFRLVDHNYVPEEFLPHHGSWRLWLSSLSD